MRVLGPAATGYLFEDGPYPDTGWSFAFEKSTSLDPLGMLTAEAWADPYPGPPLKLDWDKSNPYDGLNCTVEKLSVEQERIHCSGNAPNPLVWSWAQWAATVTYEIDITLTFSGDGRVYYEVWGSHDGYPNYGIWVGDQLIYDYHHGDQTPWSLGSPMEMVAYRSGVLQ